MLAALVGVLLEPGVHGLPMTVLAFPGNPVPKARVRVPRSNSGRFTPSDADERELRWLMRLAYRGEMLRGSVAAAFHFVRRDRLHCDVDNLVKLAIDSGTGVLWEDDAQVEWQISGVEVGPDPRTVIAFAALPASMASRYRPVRPITLVGGKRAARAVSGRPEGTFEGKRDRPTP